MGADSDCCAWWRSSLREVGITDVRIDTSALGCFIQHPVWGSCRFRSRVGHRPDLELFIPRYSGRDPSFLGLVIVIGPVDCVDNPHRRRWGGCRAVHHQWTRAVDNAARLWMTIGCPQAGLFARVVTHSVEAFVHRLSPLSAQGVRQGAERMSTELSPGCGQIKVSGRHPAGYRLVTPTPLVWTTLWTTLWARCCQPCGSRCGSGCLRATGTGCGSCS
jgi:hypothetical protein